MAVGGTYVTHNKTLPGSYINFVSKARANASMKDRGVATIALRQKWGKENEIITITSEKFQKDALKIFGKEYTDDELLPIREIFRNARELKIFRLGGGEKASTTMDKIKIEAKYGGSLGNDIKVRIAKNVDETGVTVYTYIKNIIVDETFLENKTTFMENDYIKMSITEPLNNHSGIVLQGGSDNEVTNAQYSRYLELVEKESFNTIIYDGDDEKTKGLFESFTKRLREDEGVKISLVLHNYAKANFEGVISVKNDKKLVYWTGGATAGAEINESLTNKAYDGEYKIDDKYSNRELKEAVEKGEFVFYNDISDIKVLKDINTFTNTSQIKNIDFSSNQIIRVLDATANDIARIFNRSYLGKIQNDSLGRDMFKSELIDYFKMLQSISAIENFTAKDISILKGKEKGDVVVEASIEPVGSMEKLYMKCIIE